jgi:hypothetical protein
MIGTPHSTFGAPQAHRTSDVGQADGERGVGSWPKAAKGRDDFPNLGPICAFADPVRFEHASREVKKGACATGPLSPEMAVLERYRAPTVQHENGGSHAAWRQVELFR